jgi:hypothetical protein
MLSEKEIKEMYLSNIESIDRLTKKPEFIISNYNFYLQIVLENRILKRILEIE